MTIAFLAHDSKKELMADFCNAYSGILTHYNLIATASTGNVVRESTGLNVRTVLDGSQQIASLIACGEIDLVLMFNSYNSKAREAEYYNILRLCDMYTVPVATNIASAEVLVRALGRGDLDWRNIEMDEDAQFQVS
ncbi:MAG: methylglyoxal synthase [Oscillospiraceae bacterium]|nr:methylglyoxal synthase [Oscillospiraceae bacterium]